MGDDDYMFIRIADAISCINQRVNLIGIVIETSLPKHAQGTDFFCALKIVDESRPNFGIYVNFFAETPDKLPQVNSVGDIIIVSQVLMKIRGSEVYAMYIKRNSTFAVFEGRDWSGREFIPFQISVRYKAREQDKKLVTELRKWFIHSKVEGSYNLLQLREIREGGPSNLLCKLLHVYKFNKDDWMLLLWDGTDTPPLPVETRPECEINSPLPLQFEPYPLSRDVLCTFPSVGTVLRMVIDQSKEKICIPFVCKNRWVKFIGIKFEVHIALWSAVLLPSSKLCYLPNDDDRVLERQRSYDERVASRWGRMPFTSFPWPSRIIGTDHPDMPFVTVMDILTNPEVTAKFKCVVRVVAIFPWRANDFCSPSGVCRVRLTLEDPTARIHAFLYAEDGMKFLGNFHSADILARKRNMLLGINEGDGKHIRNPPWIQCCLKSYYVDKSDIWGSRNFRICDTTFVG